MNRQKTQTLADEMARAAEMIDEMGLIRTVDDIPCEHSPRHPVRQSGRSVRVTVGVDMVKDAEIGTDGAYQPCLYAGGAPLLVDEPCVILRPHPNGGGGDE